MKVSEYQKGVENYMASYEEEGGGEKPKDDTVELHDKRKVLAATQVKAKETDLKSGKYPTKVIKNIIKAAKKVGVDPNTALAIALQETHFGKLNPENLGNVYANYKNIPEGLDKQSYEMVAFLKEKLAEGKKLGFTDEALQLQMYNGLGKLGPQLQTMVNGKLQYLPEKYYGIQVTHDKPIDMRKNPLYGKTIIDLRENLIKKNEQIQQFISSE